ncbi:Ca2+-binding protein, RTX toxin-related [Paracoccus isoporae]|uniref:Ca2+-binding protein, RTX toxin-related n=1 Tax=Paracoccus isoporae TaxID=591205 RepID=A0A1G6WAG9_9RHOB|nr:calcium-binding protein [Paracoccus isoporae]SDD62227.1 Ca2+-binding protein, RTX toxin-related [Paracoccus isoporae]
MTVNKPSVTRSFSRGPDATSIIVMAGPAAEPAMQGMVNPGIRVSEMPFPLPPYKAAPSDQRQADIADIRPILVAHINPEAVMPPPVVPDHIIAGDDGPNTLIGDGATPLHGGKGDDLYIITGPERFMSAVEWVGEGIDTVIAEVDYEMSGYYEIENLTLAGPEAVTGIGNNLNNVITGNLNDNVLLGKHGKDTLKGWGGDDRLDGGPGPDKMFGGKGDDLYIVGHAGDKVIEAAASGTDTVISWADYQLGGHVENLILRGFGKIDGTGNHQDNDISGTEEANILRGLPGDDTLKGWDGDDTLDGGWGADKMFGGQGDDRYMVDDIGDRVIEAPGTGTDTVLSSVSFRLSASVENLHLVGPKPISGSGNAAGNMMSGNHAANILKGHDGADSISGQGGFDRIVGGKGNDLLNGGAGRDTFVFFQNDGRDVIQDFTIGADLIEFRTGGGRFDDLTISQQGNKAVLAFAGSTVVLNAVNADDLDAGDFLFF